METERFKYRAGEEDLGAVALVLELAQAFERVNLPVIWAWTTHFSFSRKILRVLGAHFQHQRSAQFEECVIEPDHHDSLDRMKDGVACFCVLCCYKNEDRTPHRDELFFV